MNKKSKNSSRTWLVRQKLNQWVKDFKYLLEKTSIEIALFAVLGAGIAWYNQYNNESRRAEKIPLAFSEIGQIERDAARTGREIGPIAAYSMRLNDMCMKIFEAYNQAQYAFVPWKNTELFASNIYNARDLRNIYKYNLQDLVDTIPSYIPATNKKLATYKDVATHLSQANKNMNNSRDDDHDDQYRTELRTRTVPWPNNTTRIETYTVQVYDHTIHTYDYYKEHGEIWAQQLNTLFEQIPTLQLEETFKTTSQTNADGEYAAEKSRLLWPADRLDPEILLEIANTRYNGSTIIKNTEYIEQTYPQLEKSKNQRNIAKNTAQSDQYRTNSRYDSGPQEFQVAETTYQLGKNIETSINEMLNAIQFTQTQVPILHQKIQEFIEKWYISYASSKPEAKQLEEEIMTITKEIYKANFKEGINVDRFRRWMVFLLAFIGLLAGGGVWAGVDYLGQRTPLYNKILPKKK